MGTVHVSFTRFAHSHSSPPLPHSVLSHPLCPHKLHQCERAANSPNTNCRNSSPSAEKLLLHYKSDITGHWPNRKQELHNWHVFDQRRRYSFNNELCSRQPRIQNHQMKTFVLGFGVSNTLLFWKVIYTFGLPCLTSVCSSCSARTAS